MSDGLASRGYYGTTETTTTVLGAPTISNITPIDGLVTPGEPGAFSALFKVARVTPITFHLADITGGEITISVRYNNRNETYTVRDAEGSWLWPFDVQEDNVFTDLGGGEADVSMMPRGGWPPTEVEFKVAAAAMAVPA